MSVNSGTWLLHFFQVVKNPACRPRAWVHYWAVAVLGVHKYVDDDDLILFETSLWLDQNETCTESDLIMMRKVEKNEVVMCLNSPTLPYLPSSLQSDLVSSEWYLIFYYRLVLCYCELSLLVIEQWSAVHIKIARLTFLSRYVSNVHILLLHLMSTYLTIDIYIYNHQTNVIIAEHLII